MHMRRKGERNIVLTTVTTLLFTRMVAGKIDFQKVQATSRNITSTNHA
jgi:hypothetical protein